MLVLPTVRRATYLSVVWTPALLSALIWPSPTVAPWMHQHNERRMGHSAWQQRTTAQQKIGCFLRVIGRDACISPKGLLGYCRQTTEHRKRCSNFLVPYLQQGLCALQPFDHRATGQVVNSLQLSGPVFIKLAQPLGRSTTFGHGWHGPSRFRGHGKFRSFSFAGCLI